MSCVISYQGKLARLLVAFFSLFVLMTTLSSCNKPESPKAVQTTFSSPADAGAAFFEAAKAGDQTALLADLRARIPGRLVLGRCGKG